MAIPPLTAASSRERPGESPSQQEDAMGVILFLQTAAVGSGQKGQIQMPAACMGRKEMASSV